MLTLLMDHWTPVAVEVRASADDVQAPWTARLTVGSREWREGELDRVAAQLHADAEVWRQKVREMCGGHRDCGP